MGSGIQLALVVSISMPGIASEGEAKAAEDLEPKVALARLLGRIGDGAGIIDVAVGPEGGVYVVGQIGESRLRLKNAAQGSYAGGKTDAFVARLDPRTLSPAWFTFLGGSDDEMAGGVALDPAGNVWVTGQTASVDFPLQRPLQSQLRGGKHDAFVAKIQPDGTSLLFSTFLGSDGDDNGRAIHVDAEGQAYVTGVTGGAGFPTQAPLQAEIAGKEPLFQDAFVAKLVADGSRLVYATYLGGAHLEEGSDVTADAMGAAIVTGVTWSNDFPTVRPLQGEHRSSQGMVMDAFVAKLSPDGSKLLWSTYLGGEKNDWGFAVALQPAGGVCVAGVTSSEDFPLKDAVHDTALGGDDGFVAVLSADGSELLFGTYFPGTAQEIVRDLAVDASGRLLLTGRTSSDDFPTRNAFEATFEGPTGSFGDGFVASVALDPPTLVYSSYLAGAGHDFPLAIAAGDGRRVYVVGRTGSTDLCGLASSPAGSTSSLQGMTGFVVEVVEGEAPSAPSDPRADPGRGP